MNSTVSTPAALRKAAILIATLDPRGAEALLGKMPPETANRVRQLVLELDDVDPDEQNAVIQEFMQAGGQGQPGNDGVELDPSLRDKIASPNGYAEHNEVAEVSSRPPPFGFLRDATSEVLARHLERQHPQVIAVVAAHLSPMQAANVIKQLSSTLQADVLRRVAELDSADREVLNDIERELESLLSDDLRIARNRQTGLATVLTILNAAGSDRGELLESLSKHQHRLANELSYTPPVPSANRPSTVAQQPSQDRSKLQPSSGGSAKKVSTASGSVRRSMLAATPLEPTHRSEVPGEADPASSHPSAEMQNENISWASDSSEETALTVPEVAFDELTGLRDEDWAVLIRSVQPQVILLALTGASEPLIKRITQRLSKTEAQTLRNKLHQTGPLRLSDIEQAQRHVALLASRLGARGAIQLPQRRGFAAAA